jgi:hypothetical protein
MSDINCNSVYKKYGGRSPAMAGVSGFLSGLGGLLGLGGFWKPVSDSALQRSMDDFNKKKEQLSEFLEKEQENLLTAQKINSQRQLQLMQTIQDSHTELLSEEIGKNTLIIQVTVILLIIVIIYLLVL